MSSKKYSISKVINTYHKILFKIVTDFERYREWNTIITDAKGKLIEGNQLQLNMKINGTIKRFTPIVTFKTMNRNFKLSKTIISKRIAELTNTFEFIPLNDNRTKFIQTWTGCGILMKIIWPQVKTSLSHFEIFNHDLIDYIKQQELTNITKV